MPSPIGLRSGVALENKKNNKKNNSSALIEGIRTAVEKYDEKYEAVAATDSSVTSRLCRWQNWR